MAGRNRISKATVLAVQLIFAAAFTGSWLALPPSEQNRLTAQIKRTRLRPDIEFTNRRPAVVSSLYNDATVVSEAELRAVLEKVVPRFSRERLKPNYVEHALRAWGCQADFHSPKLISGPQLTNFLLNSGQYVASWGNNSLPILQTAGNGIRIRWGGDTSASVHHDHLLASLAEAGVSLDRPVYTTNREATMEDVLSEALRDFRLDERETEWSTLAFALYLAPQRTSEWHNAQGRRISFDLMAKRLMRADRSRGVCLGTHRVYSLMALLRLNKAFDSELISPLMDKTIFLFLQETRDLVLASQASDGSWPPNWYDGKDAQVKGNPEAKLHRRVIATGHQLEWLAIAPESLQPPRGKIRKAADWLIKNVNKTPQEVIDANYTFYSHVGNALALWRGTTPAEFWANESPE